MITFAMTLWILAIVLELPANMITGVSLCSATSLSNRGTLTIRPP